MIGGEERVLFKILGYADIGNSLHFFLFLFVPAVLGTSNLKSNLKVLLYLSGPNKDKPDPKQINGNGDLGMGFYFLPGFFHTFAPIDIIKN